VPTVYLDLEADRGNSDLLVPHTVVVSGFVALPGRISVSGLLHGTSGQFISASTARPVDVDGDGIRSSRAPGTTRNEFTGPGALNVDVRVEKRFAIGPTEVSGLLEFFNLFNASNPRVVHTDYVNGAPSSDFGTIRVPLPGREAQLGIRVRF
jgi:hypothetical protein